MSSVRPHARSGLDRTVVVCFDRVLLFRGGGASNQPATDSESPILELQDATKSYGAVRALRDGNLALRSGEVRALMGENGAGKSTLVKVLGGVVRRDAGEMLVDGESVRLPLPARRPRRRASR